MRLLTKLFIGALVTLVSVRAGFYDDTDVVILDNYNFAEEVYQTEKVWVVEFYAPWCGHCQAFSPEYIKAAKELKGLVKVGAVDCDEEKDLCSKMGIQSFPTIAIFPSEQKREKDTIYKDGSAYQGARKAKALTKAALRMLPNFVTVIDETKEIEENGNVDAIEQFLASSPSGKLDFRPAKVLLFSEKAKPTDLIKALAMNHHYVIDFALVVNPTPETREKYGVTSLPAFVAVESVDNDEEKVPSAALFEGKVSRTALARFLAPYRKAVMQKYRRNDLTPADIAAAKIDKVGKGAGSKDPHEWDLRRIASAADWNKYCMEKQGVCIVAVLDPYNSPDEVESQEATLKELAEKYSGKWHFMWLGAKEQPKFVDTFDMRSGFPAMIVLNPARAEGAKAKYIKYVGSFRMEALEEFLDSLAIGGRGALQLEKEIVIDDVNPEDFLPPKDIPLDEDDFDDVIITDSKKKDEL